MSECQQDFPAGGGCPKNGESLSFPHVFAGCCRIILGTLIYFSRSLNSFSGLFLSKKSAFICPNLRPVFYLQHRVMFLAEPIFAEQWLPDNPEVSERA